MQRVAVAYGKDSEMLAALDVVLEPKKPLVEGPENLVGSYRADLSEDCGWRMEGARFFVVSKGDAGARKGCVFETLDARRFVAVPAATREEADRRAAVLGAAATVLAIRPEWTHADAAWIAADPEFWRRSPAARVPPGRR
jgi:hypothetical protein